GLALVLSLPVQGKDVFPVADEPARRKPDQRVAFPDEMRLVEIAGFLDDLRPWSRGLVLMGGAGGVEADRPRIKLRRESHLRRETTLKMTRAETGALHQRVDPDVAARSLHQPRGMADAILAPAIEQHAEPVLRRGNARGKILRRANRVLKQ